MYKSLTAAAVLALACAAPADAASVTIAGLADSESGTSFDLDALVSPTANWSLGAGVGKSESSLTSEDFSGNSLRFSTDLDIGAFFVGAAMQRWKDSSQLQSTSWLGSIGWMTDTGFALSALVDDRKLSVQYTTTILGQVRSGEIDFAGTGFGADLSWYGDDWHVGARYIDYTYGRSVARVRAVLDAPNTQRFPQLSVLIATAVTRAAGAPDQQFVAMAGRQFSRSSLRGDFGMQRDALTRTKVHSLSLTHGYEIGARVQIDTTLGFSDGGADSTIAYGGLALTLRSAAR